MNRFARFVVDHPYPVIIVIAVVTLVFGFMMKDLQLETDITKSLPKDIPEIVFYEEVQELFPAGNMMLVGLESQRLFSSEIIRLIDDLANEFAEIDGVIRVLAPTNIDLIRGTEWGMEVSPIIDRLPETSDEIDSFRRDLTENRMYSGLLVSEDEHAAAMIVTLDLVVEEEEIYEQMQSIIDQHTVEGVEYHISGQAAMIVETAALMNRDLVVLTPIVLAVLLIVLYLSFRSVRGVVLPMLTVVVSLVWTFGIMAVANIPLNIMTTVLPVLLIAIGSAYGIHMLNRYFGDLADGIEKKQAIVESVNHTGVAVLMAGLTTVAGFMALRSSPLGPIQEFGFLTAIGIVCALTFSLTFIPAALALLPPPRVIARDATRREARAHDGAAPRQMISLRGLLQGLGRLVNTHRWVVIIIGLGVIGLSVVGMFRIRVETDMLQMFGEGTSIRQNADFITDNFSGITTLQIVVDGGGPDTVASPEILSRIDGLQRYLEDAPAIGSTQSLADMVKEMNQVMNEGMEEYYVVPDSQELVSQYLLLYSFSGGDDALESMVDFPYQNANVTAFLRTTTMSELLDLVRNVDMYLEENFRSVGIDADLTGSITILTVLNDLLIASQIRSMLISLGLVFLITSVLFGSLVIGLLAVIPLVVTVSLNFGIMGLFGIPLDIGTVMISSIAIGIGIDYAIHFLARYRTELVKGASAADAIVTTTSTTGRAIVFNAIAVGLGFLVLAFSSIYSLGMVGWIIALTMLVSSVGSMTLLPAILSLLDGTRIAAVFHRHKPLGRWAGALLRDERDEEHEG